MIIFDCGGEHSFLQLWMRNVKSPQKATFLLLHEAQCTWSSCSLHLNIWIWAVKLGVLTIPVVGCVELISPSWWDEPQTSLASSTLAFLPSMFCTEPFLYALWITFAATSSRFLRRVLPMGSYGTWRWHQQNYCVWFANLQECHLKGSFFLYNKEQWNSKKREKWGEKKHKTCVELILNRFSTLPLTDTMSLVSSETYRHHKTNDQSHYRECGLANAKVRDQVVLPASWETWGHPGSEPCLQCTEVYPCGSAWWRLVWESSEDPSDCHRSLTVCYGKNNNFIKVWRIIGVKNPSK